MKPGYSMEDIRNHITKRLRISPGAVSDIQIFRKSIDARKKDAPLYILTVDADVGPEEKAVLKRCRDVHQAENIEYTLPGKAVGKASPVVVGFGPAGMFAALILAECGLNPIVFERGGRVEERSSCVNDFFNNRILDTETNIQFGEGGAGTFSDGKLNTGIKDPRIRKVLKTFAENGAPEEILYDAKPHIGTDKLPGTVKNIREKIISLGGKIYFNALVKELIIKNGAVTGVKALMSGSLNTFFTDSVILAIGHSSRDTFRYLYSLGIPMEAKAFSIGARIEHRREMINEAQYGKFAALLPTADYKLSAHLPGGRGVYTFCMCPGGTVVAAASEKNAVVTNGMSVFARDAENSNSALLVGVTPSDFGCGALDGVEFQEKMERQAFELAGSNYNAPAQRVEDFLKGKPSEKAGDVKPSYLPGVALTDLSLLLPEYIYDSMRAGIVEFGRKLKGFDYPDAVLTAPETRSSSPVRIIRNEHYMSAGVAGLYPCGEGAGYAGGITSAAVDGIKCAEAILSRVLGK